MCCCRFAEGNANREGLGDSPGAPAAMPSRGQENPRRGIGVSSRWGWGPSASENECRLGRMNAIEVRQIVKKFGEFTAVNGITFDVEAGEIFGLLGPNGAGKSTLIRMLVPLLPPTAGTALVNGFNVVTQSDDVRKSIGVIAQAMTSDLELSVEENLVIYAKLYS